MNDDIMCACFFPHTSNKMRKIGKMTHVTTFRSIERAHEHDAPFLLAQNSLVSLFSPCARFFFRAIYIYREIDRDRDRR